MLAYKVVHTGPNAFFGGLQDGLFKVWNFKIITNFISFMNHNFSCLKCQLTSYQSMLFLVIREPGTAPIKGKATNAAVFIHSDIFKNDFILSQPNPDIFTFRPGNNSFCFDKNDGLRNTEKHATNS